MPPKDEAYHRLYSYWQDQHQSDQVPRSSCQFAENKETEGHANLSHNCVISQIQTVGNSTGLGSLIDKLQENKTEEKPVD